MSLTLPSTNASGRPIMLSPEVQEMVDWLHNGYPTLGWEGDERLGLYYSDDGSWQLDRLCEDNVMRTVCRSRPGVELDQRLIMRLVEHDARRGHDAAESVIKHNDDLKERRDAEAVDALLEPTDRVMWGIVKDVGHLY